MIPHENVLSEMQIYASNSNIPVIGPEAADFIKSLVSDLKPSRILEIGTAIGYSAVFFSKTLCDNCMIDTIEKDYTSVLTALLFIKKAGCEKNINVIFGDAKEVLASIEKKYDLVFIDAAKNQYNEYLELVMRLIDKNAVVIADNISYKGMVTDESYDKRKNRTIVRSLRRFRKTICESGCFITNIYDIGDGISVSRYLGGR